MHMRLAMGETARGPDWATALPSLFPKVSFSAPPSRACGVIEGASFAGARLWAMTTPALVVRSRQDAGLDDQFSMLVQVEGTAGFRQEGRSCRLEPGDFCLIDGHRPFEIRAHAATRHVLLQIPHAMIIRRFPRLLDQTGRAFCGKEAGPSLAGRLVVQAAETMGALGPAEQAAVLASVINLLGAIAGLDAADPRVGEALAVIERRFGEAELDAGAVALALGLSRRRLDDLFKARLGQSISARIWSRRLEESARLLRVAEAGRSITDIALTVGFGDPAHFARAFRRRFDTTPRSWRGAASGSALPSAEASAISRSSSRGAGSPTSGKTRAGVAQG